MGSVCSAEKNKNKEVGGKTLGKKLKKLKSIAKGKGDCYSNSRTSDRGTKQKERNSGFSSEFNLSNPSRKEGKEHSYKALFNSKNFTHTAELSTESENTYLKQGLASIGSTKDTSFKAEVQHWSNKASKLQDEKAFDIINLASKDAASATEIWH
ncbi:hypothetical protein HKD37_14G040999 [Glycine soja]